MLNFLLKKTFFDEVINQIVLMLDKDIDRYSAFPKIKKWILDDIKDESLEKIKIQIKFSISQEYQYYYILQIVINEEKTLTSTANLIDNFNDIPLEIRKALILNHEITLEK
jgi:hypothetical protein